jgi:hypothetical protein
MCKIWNMMIVVCGGQQDLVLTERDRIAAWFDYVVPFLQLGEEIPEGVLHDLDYWAVGFVTVKLFCVSGSDS